MGLKVLIENTGRESQDLKSSCRAIITSVGSGNPTASESISKIKLHKGCLRRRETCILMNLFEMNLFGTILSARSWRILLPVLAIAIAAPQETFAQPALPQQAFAQQGPDGTAAGQRDDSNAIPPETAQQEILRGLARVDMTQADVSQQDPTQPPPVAAQAQPATPAPNPGSTESGSTPAAGQTPETEPPGGKRVLGVLPNYRTADASLEGTVLTPKQKFTIAFKDSFDYPLVLLAGAFAGLSQLTDGDKSFGQGVEGYAHRLGTWYADEALGNMFTEGLFPALFHQDPRYFRKATGRKWGRTGYALTRVIVTQKDGGGRQFNYSEWVGNAAATAIGNVYHPDSRDAYDNSMKLLEQVGTDAISQVIKEFWPDLKRKWFHRG